jgi:hypothetical protein
MEGLLFPKTPKKPAATSRRYTARTPTTPLPVRSMLNAQRESVNAVAGVPLSPQSNAKFEEELAAAEMNEKRLQAGIQPDRYVIPRETPRGTRLSGERVGLNAQLSPEEGRKRSRAEFQRNNNDYNSNNENNNNSEEPVEKAPRPPTTNNKTPMRQPNLEEVKGGRRRKRRTHKRKGRKGRATRKN